MHFSGDVWKLTPSQMFLVSVNRVFRIAMRGTCGETTSKVVCEISAFYDFAENPITLSFVCFKK